MTMSSGLTPEDFAFIKECKRQSEYTSHLLLSESNKLLAIIDRLLSGATSPEGGRDAVIEECAQIADAERTGPSRRIAVHIRGLKSRPATSVLVVIDRDAVLEEAAKCVPMNWCDILLSGPETPNGPLGNPGVEQLLRGIQGRIRALKSPPKGEA